jgi:hypothetical protein
MRAERRAAPMPARNPLGRGANIRTVWRYGWPSIWTVAGLALGTLALAVGARARLVQGAVEFSGGGFARLLQALPGCRRFGAITIGHVVLGRDTPTLDALRAHEQVHVRQYEAWGPLFVPAYLGASAWCWLGGRDPYLDNPFEKAAHRA